MIQPKGIHAALRAIHATALVELGWPVLTVARLYGISHTKMSDELALVGKLSDSGLSVRGVGRPKGLYQKNAARNAEWAARYRNGETLKAIGADYAISHERVRQILRKLGVDSDTGGQHVRAMLKQVPQQQAARAKRAARILRNWDLLPEEFDAFIVKYGKSPMERYRQQRVSAYRRGIGWEFTFRAWWQCWQESGLWHLRGRGEGYCMARFGDSGPYSPTNVEIITIGQNFSDSHLVKPRPGRLQENCKRGHPLSGTNLYNSVKGHRQCKACAGIRQRQRATNGAL